MQRAELVYCILPLDFFLCYGLVAVSTDISVEQLFTKILSSFQKIKPRTRNVIASRSYCITFFFCIVYIIFFRGCCFRL